MLPMRYLLHDQILAESALRHWNHDPDQRDFGERFRISANAVYPYYHQNSRHFLRLSPHSEKAPGLVTAEMDFIKYLRSHGFATLQPDVARDGQSQLSIEHDGERYNCTSFATVPGCPLSDLELTPELVRGYGRTLAELHIHSSAYSPGSARRPSHLDTLDWIVCSLQQLDDESTALEEAVLLHKAFASLPKGRTNFGLIHYDFEPDNVFHDAVTDSFHIIDFDDCHYHWYAMDVTVALAELAHAGESSLKNDRADLFLEGYRAKRELPGELQDASELFRRYRDLYGYTRIVRCLNDNVPGEEAEWMTKLRHRLHDLKTDRSVHFGQPL